MILVLQSLLFIFCSWSLEVPELKGRVNDNAQILTQSQVQQLEGVLTKLENKTDVQMAILIIPSLEGDSLERYSIEVASKWALGQKDTDKGVLLLIAYKDKKIRIEVGYGLEGKITDVYASRIIRQVMAPSFKNGNPYKGIVGAVTSIAFAIDPNLKFEGVPHQKPPEGKKSDSNRFLLFLFLAIIWTFFRIFAGPFSGGMGGGWSSRSGGFSSGGGGFSGGGGGFGGGGASGGW